MSSTYRILCLSHDPAIVLPAEWQSGLGGRDALMAVLNAGEVEGHSDCDLVGGRFSYPLTEAYCPAGSCRGGGWHNTGRWTDVTWLRLARVAAVVSSDTSINPDLGDALRGIRCWAPSRVARLRNYLDPS